MLWVLDAPGILAANLLCQSCCTDVWLRSYYRAAGRAELLLDLFILFIIAVHGVFPISSIDIPGNGYMEYSIPGTCVLPALGDLGATYGNLR